jgi:hypothetical protein
VFVLDAMNASVIIISSIVKEHPSHDGGQTAGTTWALTPTLAAWAKKIAIVGLVARRNHYLLQNYN